MKTQTALAYFEDSRRKLALAADVSTQSVSRWVKLGYVPLRNAKKLAKKTQNELQVDVTVYP